MHAPTHETTFIVTRESPPENGFFQGYFFHGTDYIFGEEGLHRFQEATGHKVAGGLDGCYVLARHDSDGFIFENDFAGYKALFYYHDDQTWAVSNSFALIVDHLRASLIRIIPNYSQLAAILTPGSASSQLFSFETTVRNIRLVPRATSLRVSADGVELNRRPKAPASSEYSAALSGHLDLWAGRFETLVLDGRIGVTTDVTGGVDSRTNFGLLALAKRRLSGEGTAPRLNCGSTPGNLEDLEVAKILAKHYGWEINDGRRFKSYNLTGKESFDTFLCLNGGVSYTLYIPIEGPHPHKISIGGGGGEIHRQFYEGHLKSKSVDKFITSYSSKLKYPWLRGEFADNGYQALGEAVPTSPDLLRVHYREFRHRFHVGRAPKYGVAFTPLDSVTADATQAQAGSRRLDNGQFNYDVLASLDPELLEIEFDKPSKAPTAEIRSMLTHAAVSMDARPGRAWCDEPHDRPVPRSDPKRHESLRTAVQQASDNPFVKDFWGQEVISAANDLLDRMLNGAGIGNAVNGKPISALLAADLASPRH